MSKEARIAIEKLSIAFGETVVVKDFALSCRAGECVVITGRNGSGKTTILNILSGILRLHQGVICIDGQRMPKRWNPHRAFRNGIRRSYQIPRNWESLDVVENLVLPGHIDMDRTRDILRQLFPSIEFSRSPSQMSFGQRRLLELTRLANSGNCRIAFLDEPLAGLDGSAMEKASTDRGSALPS